MMDHPLTRFSLVVTGLFVAASIGIVACASQADDVDVLPECAMPADTVSAELLAFLSMARASHLRADLALEDERIETAIAALDKLVDGPLPAGQASPEAREVMADTLARSAELRSSIGRFEAAKADVARGLLLAAERTHYRGRLMEVLGAVEARLHTSLTNELAEQTEAGGASAVLEQLRGAAADAKKRAIEASLEAIDIQEEVIHRALAEDPDEQLK